MVALISEFLVFNVVFLKRIAVLEYLKSVDKLVISKPLLSSKYNPLIFDEKLGPSINKF